MGERDLAAEQANKDRIRAAFESWAAGTGGPFDLLADDASWTIVGTTPVSGTYESRRAFLDSVVAPFNARMQTPLRPRVRALFSEGGLGDRAVRRGCHRPRRRAVREHLHLVPAAVRGGDRRGDRVLRRGGVHRPLEPRGARLMPHVVSSRRHRAA